MICPFCKQELPEGAKFCYKCHKQIACLNCGKELVAGSDICVFCGEEISKSMSSNGCVNHIRYVENEQGKTFETSFSNETAGNVASVFAQLIHGFKRPQLQLENSEIEEKGVDIDYQPNESVFDSPKKHDISQVFCEKDETVMLEEKRLKASSKSDYQARACLLFLLYHQSRGDAAISRNTLNVFMKNEKLNDGNFRAWFSHNSRYFIKNADTIELSREGTEKAQAFLSDVFDDTIENQWSPSSGTSSPKKVRSNSKVKEIKSTLPKMVDSLDLSPDGGESLENFMKKYKYRKSAPQQNLLFVYYLKQVLKVPHINQDHLYTCYRKLGNKLPNDLYHSISDTISKNRWLINASDLDLTTGGINYVEQKMKIK